VEEAVGTKPPAHSTPNSVRNIPSTVRVLEVAQMSKVLFEEVATLPNWLPAFPHGGAQMAGDDDGPPGDDDFEDDEDDEFEDDETEEVEDEEVDDEFDDFDDDDEFDDDDDDEDDDDEDDDEDY